METVFDYNKHRLNIVKLFNEQDKTEDAVCFIRKYFESYPEFSKECPMSNRVLCEECRKDTLDLLVF